MLLDRRILPLFCVVALWAGSLQAQPVLGGSGKAQLTLEKLQVLGRVLMIAAHPDDENTALLAYFARGRKMETAYLSLTRGEGGQNLIGSEQGELMGVIRTEELLAARRVDGAEQYFSRAIDFGFSKTSKETLEKWDREKILGDAVYVIRKFQPDVIVLRFSGTPRDGHGQHQASSILGKEAFRAAADPNRFPEQLKFVRPWQAKRLFLNVASFNLAMEREAEKIPNRIEINLGQYDPLLGQSFGEVAAISRSQHRSQAMGARQERGNQRNFVVHLDGDPLPAGVTDLMAGVDTTWNRVPGTANVAAALQQALAAYEPRQPEKAVPALLQAHAALAALDNPQAADWVARKRQQVEEALSECLGLYLDASADRFAAVPGESVGVKLAAVNRSGLPVEWLETQLVDRAGQTIATQTVGKALARGGSEVLPLDAKIPSSQPLTRHYWLAQPRKETEYTLASPAVLDTPNEPAAWNARYTLRIQGKQITFTRPVWHRYVDRVYGELTRPLLFVPPAVVNLGEKAFLFPTAKPRQISVLVTAMTPNVSGEVQLSLPAGWTAQPASAPFRIGEAFEQASVAFQVTPAAANGSTGTLEAKATVNGQSYALSTTNIDYPHIPPQIVFAEAKAKLVRTDVTTLSRRVGYIMGAGDEVPRALQQMGCEVTQLSAADLSAGDLSKFDAIVTGVRAFNTRADLRANAKRLYAYAQAGGTVVVQYNVVEGGFWGGNPKLLADVGPFPIETANLRVTVEEAPVTFDAKLPLFNQPNKITDADFAGWIQERGLYFASKYDPKYTSLFTLSDPGENPQTGATLYAQLGKGAYVFTPMAWFRQLPNGVPGAYRIFANFLSAGKRPGKR